MGTLLMHLECEKAACRFISDVIDAYMAGDFEMVTNAAYHEVKSEYMRSGVTYSDVQDLRCSFREGSTCGDVVAISVSLMPHGYKWIGKYYNRPIGVVTFKRNDSTVGVKLPIFGLFRNHRLWVKW